LNQTYTSPTNTQFLEVVDHIIFVKEYSANLKSFNFAAYLFDAEDLSSTNLKRVQINPLIFNQGDIKYGLTFSKVLGYHEPSNTLNVIMSNKDVTYIHSKILKEDGKFDKEIRVTDSKSTIAIGNSKLLFDS
jgi:hypothetical protein